MPKISLKVHFPNSHEGYKMLQFEDSLPVKKAIDEIYQKQNERKANLSASGKGKSQPGSISPPTLTPACPLLVSDYGLFLFKDQNGTKIGHWLEPERELQYYLLRDGVLLML